LGGSAGGMSAEGGAFPHPLHRQHHHRSHHHRFAVSLFPVVLCVLASLVLMTVLESNQFFTFGADGSHRSSDDGFSSRRPVIILPGLAASKLEVRLNRTSVPEPYCETKTSDWRLSWITFRELKQPKCFRDQLQLKLNLSSSLGGKGESLLSSLLGTLFDFVHASTDRFPFWHGKKVEVKNQEGVEVRAHDFGGVQGITRMHKLLFDKMTKLVVGLERSGWVAGENLFAAPYDWRHAADGLQEIGFYEDLRALIEESVRKSDGRKAVIVGHSLGSLTTAHFLLQQPVAWRQQYVHGFVSIAAPFGGSVHAVKAMLTGEAGGIPFVSPALFHDIQKSCTSALWLMPRKHLWGDEVVLETATRNFTAGELPAAFASAGMVAQAAILDEIHDQLDAWRVLESSSGTGRSPGGIPGVESTLCLYSTNVSTVSKVMYDEDIAALDTEEGIARVARANGPRVLKDMDGDGLVNLRSLKECDAFSNKVREFDGIGHRGMLQHPEVLQLVMEEATIDSAPAKE